MTQDNESTPKIMTGLEIKKLITEETRPLNPYELAGYEQMKFISLEHLNRIIDEFDFKDKDGLIIPDGECNWHIRDTHWFPEIKIELKKRVSGK